MTPLHVASSHGAVAVAKCLIEASANLRSLDEEQMTPLHFACMEGNLIIANLLFDAGRCIFDWLSYIFVHSDWFNIKPFFSYDNIVYF